MVNAFLRERLRLRRAAACRPSEKQAFDVKKFRQWSWALWRWPLVPVAAVIAGWSVGWVVASASRTVLRQFYSASIGPGGDWLLNFVASTFLESAALGFGFVMAGLGFNGQKVFVLPTFGISSEDMGKNLELPRLVALLDKLKAQHKLIVLDGCNGTFGLDSSSLHKVAETSDRTASAGDAFQILAGSKDDEYSYESFEAGGGVLTSALVTILDESSGREPGSVQKLFEPLTKLVERMTRGFGTRQTPKLVNIWGNGIVAL